MRTYDMHTHIIPGIDDGAKNAKESIELLKMLKSQGISDVVLTPHYYPFEMPVKEFLARRQRHFDEIKPAFDELDINYHLGAEVYFSDVIFAYDDLKELCVDGKNYLLLELPFDEKNATKVINWLHKISANYSVKIIIAHIERYPKLFNEDFLREVNEFGCLVQFDIDSLKKIFLKGKIIKYIKRGYIHLAGSDCHDLINRPPSFDLMKKNLKEDMYYYLLNIFDTLQ